MAEKDISERNLEAYNDVFADIVNVLIFDGQRIVDENELETAEPRSSYKADGNLHEMERDVSKYWQKKSICIAFVGLENQTNPHPHMPVRVIGYDGAAYRAQLRNMDSEEKNKGIYPVVTLVLYFGQTHWNKPRTLYECLDVPEELKPYVNNYEINLFEISYLTDEQVNKFQSDFRIVADYFVQSRKDKDYVPVPGTIKHVHEVLQLMEALTGDTRFEEAQIGLKGGEETMAEAMLDRFEEKAMKKALYQSILNLMETMNLSMEQAMDALKVPPEQREFFVEQTKK